MRLNYSAWKNFTSGKTPATTPLPNKLPKYLTPSPDKLIIDIGCGWGRVAVYLYQLGYSVIGTDINRSEIEKAKNDSQKLLDNNPQHQLKFRVDDATKSINLPEASADAVILNGVLLTMIQPQDRQNLISKTYRLLKPGGILFIAEFEQSSDPTYPINYQRHALITKEVGTIVSFKDKNTTFKGKTDDEVKALAKPANIAYFSHHYSEKELQTLLKKYKILEFKRELFTTGSNKQKQGVIIYAIK